MSVEFCKRGTKIEEEDFCHWTENDVQFKCLEGLNAKLKKFYSWNKAIIVEIEIDGRTFCGCLYQDDNGFAPVKFGPPKRPPLPCIMPSKLNPPKRKIYTKISSANAYSRENWPRVYIDSYNIVEQRLRSGRDKNLSNNRLNSTSRIGKENSHPRGKKVGLLVYNKRKKTSRGDQKSKKLIENNSPWRRSERIRYSQSKTNISMTKPNNESSTSQFRHPSPKDNKNMVKSIMYEGEKCDELRKTSLSSKHYLRPRRAKYGSELKFNCHAESNETLSSQYPSMDPIISPTKYDDIERPIDVVDKIIELNETSVHQVSQHSVINSKNKEIEITFDSHVFSPTLNIENTLKSANNAKEEISHLSKSKKRKKRKYFEKECSDLSNEFEKVTISAATFQEPITQTSHGKEFDSQVAGEKKYFKISET